MSEQKGIVLPIGFRVVPNPKHEKFCELHYYNGIKDHCLWTVRFDDPGGLAHLQRFVRLSNVLESDRIKDIKTGGR